MRVNNQILINNFLKSLNKTNQELFKINSSISSGKRVERPEDDAIAASNITGIESQIAETKQFQENIQQSLSQLNTVDSIFGDLSAIIMRTRELAVQAANASLSLDERDAIAVEVNQLLESMVQIGNTSVGGTPLFSGHESGIVPFEVIRGADSGEVRDIVTIDGEVRSDINVNNITRVLYKGDAEYTAVEVDQELSVNTNVTGQEMFFYDNQLNNSAPRLIQKKADITNNTLLENIMSTRNTTGVSSGYLMVKNTRGLTLREDTNPGNVDNSTPLSLLNNGRGVGRNKLGDIVTLGDVTLSDSQGTSTRFNTNVPPLNASGATIKDVVTFLNSKTYDPITNPSAPKLRFSIEADQIKMVDNAFGAKLPAARDEVIDDSSAVPPLRISTFMQDLGLVDVIQPKKIDPNSSAVGMFNDFGGIRFSSVSEILRGRIEFQGGGDFIEIDPFVKDDQKLTYDDGTGVRTSLTFDYFSGITSIDEILAQLNSQTGLSKLATDINTVAGSSYFEVSYPDGETERIELNALVSTDSTDVIGNTVTALNPAAMGTVNLQDIYSQVQTRLSRQDLNGRFGVYLVNGAIHEFNLGDTLLNQYSSLSDVVDSLNSQSQVLFAADGFKVSNDGQRVELTGDAVWGDQIQSVVDLGTGSAAFDIGLLKPFLSVNADFPNVSEANSDFPGIAFDERILLSEWTGKFNIASSVNNGQIRIQDAVGKEKLVDLSSINDSSTIEDFMTLFNSSGSLVQVELSPDGHGLRFVDNSGGSGNFFVEDFGGSTLVETLGAGTPYRGAHGFYDAGAAVLIDLNDIGDAVNTIGDLLSAINAETSRIGVSARVDSGTSQLIFEDQRRPADRGKYRVSVENAIGLKTPLTSLNEGGGINNYKIRITDSLGVSQVIDFQDAETIEDVLNRINLSNEEIDEKTTLKNISGISFPLGTFSLATSSGSVLVDLSALNESSTLQETRDHIKGQIGMIQADIHLRLNREARTVGFEFSDIYGGSETGTITIRDVTGSSAEQFKFNSIGKSSPFETGLLVHRRASIRATLNDDRTGLKITDLAGGELRITEVEGRTTAHDLGLITSGIGVGVSNNGVLRGKDLDVFDKIADDLGLSKKFASKEIQADDGITSIVGQGSVDDEIKAIRSVKLQTMALNTLAGSVDLNHRLTNKTELRNLGGAIPNPDYKGNPIKNIDTSGVLMIQALIDDGQGEYQKIVIDFNNLPDNPTISDLNRLIQEEIAADDLFEARVQMKINKDGSLKFISDYPIRIGVDDTPAPSPGANALGARTMQDLFGDEITITNFDRSHTTTMLGLQREYTGGIDEENFFITDTSSVGSLEVDFDTLSILKQRERSDLQIGDLKIFVEDNSAKPASLMSERNGVVTYPSLEDLGIKFPVNIPFDPSDPVQVDTVKPFNDLTKQSTLGDFIEAFNNSPANSVFNGVVTLEVSDEFNTLNSDYRERRLLLRDQTGLSTGDILEIDGLNKEIVQFLGILGIQPGGRVDESALGVIGIMGDQISGLGFRAEFAVDPLGQISITGQHRMDNDGNPQLNTGKMKIIEGRGSAASDLKLVTGTGAIGNRTMHIQSGDLNPGVVRNVLLSEIMPNSEGISTSFADQLKNLYLENGKESGSIDLSNPPVTMDTPFKAFQDGRYDAIAGVYRGGVDVGRASSGFVIQDQFGNQAIVDLSNNLSRYNAIQVDQITASDASPFTRLTAAVGGSFNGVQVGDFLEIEADANSSESRLRKFRIAEIDPAGTFIEIEADAATLDTVNTNGYTVNIFNTTEDLHSSMDKEYRSKPFFNENSTLRDLQKALDIALDKAKRTTGFGVDKLTIRQDRASGSFQIIVAGENGPTISILERDVNGDGILDSSTAKDLGLLRDSGATGNGSPEVTAGKLKIRPTMAYVLDKINNDFSDLKVTASIGSNEWGPTIDITSNSNSSYIKVRDTFDGNTASQLGMSSTRSIFQTLIDFRDSLFRNAPKTISDDVLRKIGEDEEKILQLRARVGSVVNRFEINSNRLDTTKIELTRRLSENQDLNITDAIIDLRKLEIAQRAALSVGSRMVQQTLLDFLR